MSLPASPSPPEGSFDQFSASARRVLFLAQEAARARNHDYMGTEHLLLGLLEDEDGLGATVLQRLRVNPAEVRQRIAATIGMGDQTITGEIGLTPRVKKVFELAVDEAKRTHQPQVDVVHLLLGIAREGNGIGGRVLQEMQLTPETLRRAGAELPSPPPEEPPVPEFAAGTGPKTNVVTSRLDDATLDALDTLVAAGIRPTRSDAAAWLIRIGLEANRSLLQRVSATVAEIRRLRLEAQSLAQQPDEEPPV
jgi:ATP-dependent Clp protease ATP-binding subunit ClpA